MVPMMSAYRVSFEVEMPDDAPEDEVEAFIMFELGARGCLRVDTASLQDTDLRSFRVSGVQVDKE